MHPALKLLESDGAPKHQVEHPVLLTIDLHRRSGGRLPEWEPAAILDAEALLRLTPGSMIQGTGWTEESHWESLKHDFANALANVVDGTITCHSTTFRIVLSNGAATMVAGKTIYALPGEILCPFCRSATQFVRNGFIEIGGWNGQRHAIEGDVSGHLCQGPCKAYFFTGYTADDLKQLETTPTKPT